MDTHNADILLRHPVPRHRLTIAEYHRLGEVGILRNNDRVELLEGQIVDMSPIGPRHAIMVDALVHSLAAAVGEKAYVRGQNPITLDEGSEPRPPPPQQPELFFDQDSQATVTLIDRSTPRSLNLGISIHLKPIGWPSNIPARSMSKPCLMRNPIQQCHQSDNHAT